jgi:dynamin 1-like protein
MLYGNPQRVRSGEVGAIPSGALISRAFIDEFLPNMDAVRGLSGLSEMQMFFLMKNHVGLMVPLFTPHTALDTILFRVIEGFRAPSLALVERIVQILFMVHGQIELPELQRFPFVCDALRAAVYECIQCCVEAARAYVNGLIDNEQAFVNTRREDFLGGAVVNAFQAPDPRARKLPKRPVFPAAAGICSIYGTRRLPTPNQVREMSDLMLLGDQYFDLIKEKIKDLVPKAVVSFLVEHSTDLLRPKLTEELLENQNLTEIFAEDPTVAWKRAACQQTIEALRQAREILSEVREGDI